MIYINPEYRTLVIWLFWATSLFAIYWLVRLAVRHEIRRADWRRESGKS